MLAIAFALLIWEGGRNVVPVEGTIDVNLSELEYLAARLGPRECRSLAAALHYDSFELPNDLAKASRKVDPSLPCLRHLLHWNNGLGEGRGRSHELLERRLRQLGRKDLADWLGRTVFAELSKDLLRVVDEPLGKVTTEAYTESQSTETTTTSGKSLGNEDHGLWVLVNWIVFGLLGVLVFTLVSLLGLIVIHRVARCRYDEYSAVDRSE
ncbi:uncharacterized protein LOC106640525 [Copidosoma floridanum]|uniref:uncharacterized protein LOC106640525 n=1 Tax=Copidosoma floridanum TaxID=29053 RepID=UPI0006C9BF8C|nr:uncharacterized protein LOC106640525 [Copidosoma floridanum]